MEANPGNRLVRGRSGIVFEVPASVASGLVGNSTCVYADEETEQPEARPAAPDASGEPAKARPTKQ